MDDTSCFPSQAAKPRQTGVTSEPLTDGLNAHTRDGLVQGRDLHSRLVDSEIWLGGVHEYRVSQHSKAPTVRELGQ